MGQDGCLLPVAMRGFHFGVFALVAAAGLHFAASQSPSAQGAYSIFVQTNNATRANLLFKWYTGNGFGAPTDLNIVVPNGEQAKNNWFNTNGKSFTKQGGDVWTLNASLPTQGKELTLRVIGSDFHTDGFSPIAKYFAVGPYAEQTIVLLQDDKMKVDPNTASTMVNVVSQRNEDPLFSGLYPRYIKNVSGSASVEAATGGEFSDGIVYKTQGGGDDGLPFQLLKGRVFVVNNHFRAIQNYTDWVKEQGEFSNEFDNSICDEIGGPLANLSTAFDLVQKYPFCDDITFQYFTQAIRANETDERVSQAWVKECPELEKFDNAFGPKRKVSPEDKTICLQGLNCLLGYKPWQYPLITRGDNKGFGVNENGNVVNDEVVDPNLAGTC